ncbi:MAG: putative toxin-antitoxin system toxin component, PIN family [Akkermansiaceae bacterium]|nr:putative toxin-antitoxin system toxin component, PIN family [Akkermansiaceae bacterium]
MTTRILLATIPESIYPPIGEYTFQKSSCGIRGIVDNTAVYAVIDTCVLVSALHSNLGASFEILQAVRHGEIRIALSVALAIEYESVALRPGLVPALTAEEIQVVVDVLCRMAHPQKIFYTWRPFLPDPDDDLVIELAAAAGCALIVTHNIKDFKGSESLGIRAITPAQALNLI